jgi:hypothetical protein
MSLARLVVIEGPDAGREFEVPLRGGGVGRGDSCLIKLTDPTVSRQHGSIELRDGAMSFVAEAGKAVLINRAPVDVHRLEAGDEIVIGATKLAYLAVDGGVAVTRVSSNVTMEVGSRQLLALVGHDDRPRRHLAAIAGLGDRLRTEAGRDAVARATCDAALSALGAHRAFVLSTGRRVTPLAAAVASNESTQLQVPQDLVDKVRERQVVTAEANGRAVLAAPIQGADNEVIGILWIDRKGQPWDQIDSLAANCVAFLAGAAWVSSDARATVLLSGESGTGKELVARDPRRQPARRRPADPRQLRRAHRAPARERAVRPREGRVHRRDRAARGPVRAGDRARCSSTRSARCRSAVQVKLLRFLRSARSSASAATSRSASTSA